MTKAGWLLGLLLILEMNVGVQGMGSACLSSIEDTLYAPSSYRWEVFKLHHDSGGHQVLRVLGERVIVHHQLLLGSPQDAKVRLKLTLSD